MNPRCPYCNGDVDAYNGQCRMCGRVNPNATSANSSYGGSHMLNAQAVATVGGYRPQIATTYNQQYDDKGNAKSNVVWEGTTVTDYAGALTAAQVRLTEGLETLFADKSVPTLPDATTA